MSRRSSATVRVDGGGPSRASPLLLRRALPRPTLVLSGLLPAELDGTAAAFAPWSLTERDRRIDGDWAALLLARGELVPRIGE